MRCNTLIFITVLSVPAQEHSLDAGAILQAAMKHCRAKYGGMGASLMKRMKELEDENRRLKKMYAETKLEAEIVQEALAKIPVKEGQAQW